MGQQLIRSFNESNRVGQLRVQLECGFVYPLGMNREHRRLLQ
jgi:hypothetical protein